jgi:hypothetical protein
MNYFEKLEDIQAKMKTMRADALRRLDNLDWEAEFREAQEDEEYSILQFDTTLSELASEIRKTFEKTPNEELCNFLADTQTTYRNEVVNPQIDRLKQEYFKRKDEDYIPFLSCETCFQFFTTEGKRKEHNCKGTTKCRNCGRDCRTKERLQAHIDALVCIKKYKCEPCEYATNSKNEYERHLNSKKHKEIFNIEKEIKVFECKDCDRQYAFESDYKKHCLSVKHKKLCPTK